LCDKKLITDVTEQVVLDDSDQAIDVRS